MGCPESKLHPKNVELAKFKKKLDKTPIRNAQPVHIWVIAPMDEPARELGEVIADKHGYLAVSEKKVLEAEAASVTERGEIINSILHEEGLVSLSVVEDLITETVLARCPGLKGVVFTDLPRCKCQKRMLKRIVGPVSLVIYMKYPEAAVRAALREGTDDKTFSRKMDDFNRYVLPLTTHKRAFTVDGEEGVAACFAACSDILNRVAIAGS